MKFKFITKDRISKIPKCPGVYVFKKAREILYIGKAANIRERIKNHLPERSEGWRRTNVLRLQQPTHRDNLFINQVNNIGYIKTSSEIEALILEANLIKKYQPKYNVVWRDDKNYFYTTFTKEVFPRIFITHQPKAPPQKLKMQNAKCKITIQNSKLKTIFVGPFVDGRTLKEALKVLRKVFPYRSCNKIPKRPCLWYQLGKCPAPCLLKSGLAKQIPDFEAKIEKESQKNAKNILKILQGRKNQALRDLRKAMKIASKLEDFEKAAKIRDQIEALERVMEHAKIFDWAEPQYPIRKPWLNYYLWEDLEKKLKKNLKISGEVSRIEAYDVSNIQGKFATGSMVTFINGMSEKNFYRRFKIKIGGKPNDIAMIKETLSRRFQHPEWGWPDLMLIDGGIGQLSVALKIKNQKSNLKNKIKVMSLAKKGNKLFIENQKEPVLLKKLPREIFNLILQLRDEAHRFAISYHRKLRKTNLFSKRN